jgi:hypothetical protein
MHRALGKMLQFLHSLKQYSKVPGIYIREDNVIVTVSYARAGTELLNSEMKKAQRSFVYRMYYV